jgi:serine/threonine-protein kinase RsbW
MRMKIALWLPRTGESVAVARRSLDRILTVLGVRPDCRGEIALAVSEACSNAVQHGTGPSLYEVAAESEDSHCVITVNDSGPGLAPGAASESPAMPDATALRGRGMALMRAMTDELELRPSRGGGLSVRLSKRLRWTDGALGGQPP